MRTLLVAVIMAALAIMPVSMAQAADCPDDLSAAEALLEECGDNLADCDDTTDGCVKQLEGCEAALVKCNERCGIIAVLKDRPLQMTVAGTILFLVGGIIAAVTNAGQ